MNILIFSWRGPGHPNFGGAELVTHEHAKAWVKKGHKVTLFTSSFKGAKEKEKIDGVKIIRKSSEFIGVHFHAFFWYLFFQHPKYDLVIDHFHGIPFFTPLYVRVKKLAFIHEAAKEVWFLNYNFLIAIIGYYLEPFIFKLFYRKIAFLTVSPSTKSDLVNWGIPKKNINVIFNGVDMENLPSRLPPKEKAPTLIFLGALTKDKGIEDALKVYSHLVGYDPSWKLWIVGKGEESYVKKIWSLASNLGILQNIVFWGFVDEKKKFELLAKAHILINPSALEGWGLVNIEANLVGTPVVGYDVAGVRDSVVNGKTGLLVSKGDYIKMAQSAVKLVANEKRYRRYQKHALKWAKKFSWKSSTKKSLELIENI